MNEEIQAYIDSALESFKGEVLEQVTNANKGLAANMSRDLKKVLSSLEETKKEEKVIEEDKLSLKSLQKQVIQLQEEVVRKDKEAFEARKAQTLSQIIASANVLNPKALQKLFSMEYGENIVEENGAWFVSKGEEVISLNEAFNEYLNSDEGKFYIAPSNVRGSDAIEVKETPTIGNKVDAAEALMQLYGNY